MSIKTRKAIADAVEATGEVVAMVSPFGGPPDLQGDVIAESAYTQDIAYWNASKNRLPVLISHDWEEPTANIGHVERLEAVQGYGLVAHIKLDLLNERARYVHKLLAERRMVEFSIGYDVLPGGQEKQRDGSTLLTRLHLIEISIVLKGAAATAGARDARTELLSVKAAPAIPTATLTDDGRTRCSNCGKFAAIPQRPTTVFSGDRVFIGMCSGCGALQGYSPKSWPPGTRADALQEIRGRAVWNIITALRDNGAPTEVIKSAMTSARYCLDDPDGYTVAEFAGRVRDLIDGAVDDERMQAEVLADVKSRLDDLVAEVSIGFKPWHVEERDGRFCVILDRDGSTVDCHDTRAEAEAQVRALYASEKTAPPVKKSAQDRELIGALDELEGVGTKRRHPIPLEDDPVDMAEHLRRFHGSQVKPASLTRMNLRELLATHRFCHPEFPFDSTTSVNPDTSMPEKALSPLAQKMLAEFDAAERGTKSITNRERAEHERFVQANEALLAGPIPSPADEAAHEASRRETEDAERDRLSNERAQRLADAQAADDASRDNRPWRQGTSGADYYTESIGAEPLPRTERRYPEPRVTEAVPGVGESIGAVPVGLINEEDARLIRQAHPDRPTWTPYGDLVIDTPIPDKSIPDEGTTVRVSTGQIDKGDRKVEEEKK